MRRLWIVAALGAVVGCDGDDTVPLPLHSATVGDDDDDDVLPSGDDEASVVLVVQQPNALDAEGSTTLTAVFAEDARGWIDLTECFTSYCTNQLPGSLGEFVTVQGPDGTLQQDLLTRNQGKEVTLGEFGAERQANDDFVYYFGGWDKAKNLGNQPMGFGFDGPSWGRYAGTDDIRPPTPMVVESPVPLESHEFVSSDVIPLLWEPGSRGDVFLLVTTPAERRLYWLEDTGSYDLDLRAMGLVDQAPVTLDLGRWSRDGVDLDGNVATLTVKSNQRLDGVWRDIGARSPIDLYDTCGEARDAPGATSGNYRGDFTDFANNLRPRLGQCTPWTALGQDAIVPVDLRSNDQLYVSYRLPTGDASLYITTDCADLGECVAGRDSTIGFGAETVTWVNNGDDQRVYVVMDAFAEFTSDFTLDLEVTSLGGAVFMDTCAEAIAQGPIAPNTYQGRIGGNANLLTPQCFLAGTGGEGVLQVYLLPGQTLDATVTTNGAPAAALYLLYNCSLGDSCLDVEPAKHLTYVNETAVSEFLYLVLDGPPGVDSYVLDLAVY